MNGLYTLLSMAQLWNHVISMTLALGLDKKLAL